MNRAKYFTVLLSILLFSACVKDVDFNGAETAPKMVVNSMINCKSDSNLLKISESVFIYSDNKPKIIEDPNLQLKINDIPVEIKFDHIKNKNSYYSFNSQLLPGDKIELSGQTAEHGTVQGVDYVPSPPQIKSVNYEWFTGDDNYSYLRTLITISDRPSSKNYYRILIQEKTIPDYDGAPTEDELEWINTEVYIDQEIVFNNIDGVAGDSKFNHTYRIFPNDLFQGKDYTLNVYIRKDSGNPWGTVERRLVRVEIQSLTESLYLYLRSVEIASNQDYFQEPVKVYSNIKEGYGILGIYNPSEKTIEPEK
jgi:hypothetical protein